MEQQLKEAIYRQVENEPFAQTLKMELVELEKGFSAVEMTYDPDTMNNMLPAPMAELVFSLIDEAFERYARQSGSVTVAMNVAVNYVSSPESGARLRAEAREVSSTKRTATYDIRVCDQEGVLIAVCQALAYRTGKPLPFL